MANMTVNEIIETIKYYPEITGEIEVHLGCDDDMVSLWDYKAGYQVAFHRKDICKVSEVEEGMKALIKEVNKYNWYVVR